MSDTFLLFTLAEHYFGVAIDEIDRVYPALAIEEFIDGPPLLSGLFTVAGRKIPVLDLRQRLQLPDKSVDPDAVLVVGECDAVRFAFFVDTVLGVHTFLETEIFASRAIYPELAEHFGRLLEFSGHTVWIYTLEQLFAETDFPALMAAAAQAGAP